MSSFISAAIRYSRLLGPSLSLLSLSRYLSTSNADLVRPWYREYSTLPSTWLFLWWDHDVWCLTLIWIYRWMITSWNAVNHIAWSCTHRDKSNQTGLSHAQTTSLCCNNQRFQQISWDSRVRIINIPFCAYAAADKLHVSLRRSLASRTFTMLYGIPKHCTPESFFNGSTQRIFVMNRSEGARSKVVSWYRRSIKLGIRNSFVSRSVLSISSTKLTT